VTLRVNVDGAEHLRCYSMSSSPATRENLRLTVKRDRGGMVSNWINDTTAIGDVFEVSAPAGAFVLDSSDKDLVAFAGGSGITPVYSLIRTALITTARHVRLFYANRERASVIFARGLDDLVARNPDRITVYHHLDEVRGVVRAQDIAAFTEPTHDAHYYICGPSPFMQTVEDTLVRKCIGRDRLHLERFQISEIAVADVDESGCGTEQVTITLDQRRTVATYRAGNTLLQTARLAGLRAPASCETGSCGTCMARLTKGSARMHNNDALTEDEVAEGWVLTCQSLPTSPTVEVVYE
jgi:ferredoxin-NADP reductase